MAENIVATRENTSSALRRGGAETSTFLQALALHQQNRTSEAETLYRQILSVEPNHHGALHFLGMVAFAQKNFTEAINLIEQSLQHCRTNAVYYNNYGVVFKELQCYKDAKTAFEHAVNLNPDYPDALSNLGLILIQQGPPYHLAEHYLLAALHLESEHPDALQHHSEIRSRRDAEKPYSAPEQNTISRGIAPPSPSKIKVLQYMYGDFEYFQWSERINRRYCERHGYDYVLRRDVPRKDRHIIWHKIEVALDEFRDCDYLLFVDADAVFYSHELGIEDELIPLLEDKTVLMSLDVGAESLRWSKNPNAGVFLIKNEAISLDFLKDWNLAAEIEPETRWKWPLEQLALWRCIVPKYKEHIQIIEDYYRIQGRYGQYIRHFMSMSDAHRSDAMKKIYHRLESHASPAHTLK